MPQPWVAMKWDFQQIVAREVGLLPDTCLGNRMDLAQVRDDAVLGLPGCMWFALLMSAHEWWGSVFVFVVHTLLHNTRQAARMSAAKVQGFRKGGLIDNRWEDSPIYLEADPRSTLLLVCNSRGLAGSI